MTELEKLEAGLPYDFRDPEVDARKLHAVKMCKVLNETDQIIRHARKPSGNFSEA